MDIFLPSVDTWIRYQLTKPGVQLTLRFLSAQNWYVDFISPWTTTFPIWHTGTQWVWSGVFASVCSYRKREWDQGTTCPSVPKWEERLLLSLPWAPVVTGLQNSTLWSAGNYHAEGGEGQRVILLEPIITARWKKEFVVCLLSSGALSKRLKVIADCRCHSSPWRTSCKCHWLLLNQHSFLTSVKSSWFTPADNLAVS